MENVRTRIARAPQIKTDQDQLIIAMQILYKSVRDRKAKEIYERALDEKNN